MLHQWIATERANTQHTVKLAPAAQKRGVGDTFQDKLKWQPIDHSAGEAKWVCGAGTIEPTIQPTTNRFQMV